jgi:hypothetical protein
MPNQNHKYTLVGLNQSLASDITFTRASPGTYFDYTGVLSIAINNIPRFTYDPATLAYKGLLLEGARTNLCTNSEDLSLWPGDGNPNFLNQSVSSSTDPKFGTIWVMNEGTNTGTHTLGCHIPPDTGNEYRTHSVYLKAGTANKARLTTKGSYFDANDRGVNIDLIAGTAVVVNFAESTGVTIENAGNGWYRVSYTVLFTGSAGFRYLTIQMVDNSFTFNYTGTGRTIKIAKPQIEVGEFASSYIATTSTAATRSADTCLVTNLASKPWFNFASGTIYADFTRGALNIYSQVVSINDGTGNNYYSMYQANTAEAYSYNNGIASGGFGQAGASFSPGTGRVKSAFAYKANDCAFVANGSAVSVATSATLPISPTQFQIGAHLGGSIMFGTIRQLIYYPKRIANNTLKKFTQ